MKESHAGIETINVALKADLADATEECDDLRQKLKTLENIVDNLHLKLKHYEAEQLDKPTIRTLQIKNEKLVAENKLIQNQLSHHKIDERDKFCDHCSCRKCTALNSRNSIKQTGPLI